VQFLSLFNKNAGAEDFSFFDVTEQGLSELTEQGLSELHQTFSPVHLLFVDDEVPEKLSGKA